MTAPNQQPDPDAHAGQGKDLENAPNEGVSAQEPAEGADDVNPPTEGSPRG
jgi:hypothetical protein